MPELPEVEIICQGLQTKILNTIILNAERLNNLKLRQAIDEDIESKLDNVKIINITRRAKYIQIFLSNNYVLIIHLGMSGKLLLKSSDYITQKHDHFAIYLNNHELLIYNDPRRFGLITIAKQDELAEFPLFKHLGIEPLSEEFTAQYLAKILQSKKQPIKLTLMDNVNIVGVGNIYACESLYLSKISPLTSSNSISFEQTQLLHSNIIKVLKDSINKGGSTLKDYRTVSGETGYFQNNFYVYGREKNNCLTCSRNIVRIVQAGRSSFYCPNCQK